MAPFPRVLLWALAGSLLGGAASAAMAVRLGAAPDAALLLGPRVIHLGCPLGAMVGALWAVGKGGTARAVALAASWAIWSACGWALFPDFLSDHPLLPAAHLLILASGWAALVWRSMARLEGGDVRMPPLSLACAGLLVGRALESLCWRGYLAWSAAQATAMPGFMDAAIQGLLMAAALVCGLSAAAALAGDLSLPWAAVCAGAWAAGYATWGMLWLAQVFLPLTWSTHAAGILWPLAEALWLAFWGRRLAAREGVGA